MLLSIIIPVFNTKVKYIEECLNSIELYMLNYENYEIIIVNDGSSDKKTNAYLNTVSNPKISVLNKSNGGLGSARNYGISHSNGKFIFPLDSDDMINEEFISFVKILEIDNSFDVLYGGYNIFGDLNLKVDCLEFNRLILFYEQNILPACSFFKKDLWIKVNGYDETFETLEDWDFWIRCCLNNAKFKHIKNKYHYNYRVVNNGKSLLQRNKHLNNFYIEKFRNKIPSLQISKKELDDFAWKYISRENNIVDLEHKISNNIITTDKHNYEIANLQAFKSKIKRTITYKTFMKLELSIQKLIKLR